MNAPDPFAQADAENEERARREILRRLERERSARRRADPMEEGGLFDEVRRASQDLFGGR